MSANKLENNLGEKTVEPTKVKKKRGRKPKPKVDVEEPTKVKKKRGRKPKPKTVTDESTKVKKKRGRKPMGKIINKMKSTAQLTKNEDECIIAHLPIQLSDDEAEEKTTTKSINSSKIFDNSLCSYAEPGCTNCQKMRKKIEDLKLTIEELKNELSSSSKARVKDTKVDLSNVNFYNIRDGKTDYNEKTDIWCWWCMHEFDDLPCPIPERYYNDTYYVWGCFCSYNCAKKYNIIKDDYKTDERNTLIHQLYKTTHGINDDEDVEIKPADDRECMKELGGTYTIKQFRENSKCIDKTCRYILPPMVSIVPMIEEDYRDKNRYEYRSKKNVPLNTTRVLKANENLKLKRSKPLVSSKFSLEKTMGLTRKKRSVI